MRLSQFINEKVFRKTTRREPALDFDPGTVPWIDRPGADIDLYLSGLDSTQLGYDLREKLLQWKNLGFAVFEQAVSSALIDAYLTDIEEFMDRHKEFSSTITTKAHNTQAKDLNRDQLNCRQMRICDLHNNAITGKKLGLNPTIISFLTHIFQDKAVMMQTLTFLRSSEQNIHQDYAFVVAQIPSHLAASWIALEDTNPDAGPLVYYPGSHRIPKFNFGNGLFLTPESNRCEAEFTEHILTQCSALGLKEVTFLPKKGDMFVWHSALAHGAASVRDPELTRKSLVCHYSSRSGYPRERRNPDVEPVIYEYNAGLVYGNPLYPTEEDILKRGAVTTN